MRNVGSSGLCWPEDPVRSDPKRKRLLVFLIFTQTMCTIVFILYYSCVFTFYLDELRRSLSSMQLA